MPPDREPEVHCTLNLSTEQFTSEDFNCGGSTECEDQGRTGDTRTEDLDSVAPLMCVSTEGRTGDTRTEDLDSVAPLMCVSTEGRTGDTRTEDLDSVAPAGRPAVN
ncbi:hypothetical protein NHX12_019964 [Muraenolepis orangiensis]|uniref:Uncharacterized protein n=1 Tax=Muraenolepis orangiensis TaxID=630683 RepID=A0A9Q0EWF2_9TELE|nr:hypothetical protein NHX12_019964 [Muraenolepis orangiensis]